MGSNEGMREMQEKDIGTDGFPRSEVTGPQGPVGRPAPSWRAWVVSIIVAIVLSVTATLLLGGSYRLTGGGVSGGCGTGSNCCPPSDGK